MKKTLYFFLPFLCLLFTACNPYKEPGNRGTLPTVNEQLPNSGLNAVIADSDEDTIPEILVCNETYGFVVRMADANANCQGYNFKPLYQAAQDYFELRKQSFSCATNCNLHTYIISQTATCNGPVATVIVEYNIVCLDAASTAPTGYTAKTDAELLAPFNDPPPPGYTLPGRTATRLEQHLEDPNATNCPYTFKYRVEILNRVANCADVNDYEPYVEAAKQLAIRQWQRTTCGPNCNKQQWEEKYVAWDCVNNGVRVEFWFEVRCR